MFSEAEIQEVRIHGPFIRVLTISYRNRSIIMKIIRKEKSYAHKLYAQKKSYAQKDHMHTNHTDTKSYAEENHRPKIIHW